MPPENPQSSEKKKGRPRSDARITAAEWIVASLGALLVLSSVAFLFYEALFSERKPPEVTAEVTDVLVQENGTLVLAEVRNRGGKTVAELTLTALAGDVEKEVTVDFVPGESTRRVGFFFDSSEASPKVELTVGSFREP